MTILTHFATSRETGYVAVEVLSFRGTVASLKAAAVSQQFPVDIRPLVCFCASSRQACRSLDIPHVPSPCAFARAIRVIYCASRKKKTCTGRAVWG